MAETHHVVVDGSNLATEGRTLPSLRQLDEAVRAYAEEDPGAEIVVVVDASFEHRIDSSRAGAARAGRAPRRGGVAAGGSHRTGRRLRAADRRAHRGHGAVQRLVPGVPRRAPLAVRRRPPGRGQAGSRRRMDLHPPDSGPWPEEPSGDRQGQPGRPAGPPACGAGEGGRAGPGGQEGGRPAGGGHARRLGAEDRRRLGVPVTPAPAKKAKKASRRRPRRPCQGRRSRLRRRRRRKPGQEGHQGGEGGEDKASQGSQGDEGHQGHQGGAKGSRPRRPPRRRRRPQPAAKATKATKAAKAASKATRPRRRPRRRSNGHGTEGGQEGRRERGRTRRPRCRAGRCSPVSPAESGAGTQASVAPFARRRAGIAGPRSTRSCWRRSARPPPRRSRRQRRSESPRAARPSPEAGTGKTGARRSREARMQAREVGKQGHEAPPGRLHPCRLSTSRWRSSPSSPPTPWAARSRARWPRSPRTAPWWR